MKIAKSIIISFFTLLLISCQKNNNYETISVNLFETALKNKNISVVSFGPGKDEVKIEFKDKPDIYLILNDSTSPKHLEKYIKKVLKKYDGDNITIGHEKPYF